MLRASECGLAVEERIVLCIWCVLCMVARELVLGEPASEARVVRTFSANDAAYLTLSGAVSQLRRCESVRGGVGLLSCVLCSFSMKGGLRQSSIPPVSSHSPSFPV